MTAARFVVVLVLASVAATAAQVPLTQDPAHRLVFENPQMRILSVNVPAGSTTLDHRHESDIVTISMTGGTDTRVHVTGQPQGPVRPARPLGDAVVTEHAGTPSSHRIENLGKSAYQLLAVENLKRSGWSTAPATSGLATTLVKESRAFRTYDVRLSLNASQASHTHAVPTVVLLLNGKVMSDGPDTQAKANAPAPVGLRQLDQPGQWLLVPAGDRHHLVRLGTTDAYVVEIEVR